jgi:hypothetical protein
LLADDLATAVLVESIAPEAARVHQRDDGALRAPDMGLRAGALPVSITGKSAAARA